MENRLLNKAAEFMLARRRQKRWQKIVSGMAAVVVFCTTYALILPAITMSNDVICGLEEHSHTEECWTTETRYPQSSMACTFTAEGVVAHEHDILCRSEDGTLICTMDRISQHSHGDTCYGEEKSLTCTETEDLGHTHSEACYTHVQGEMVYTQVEDTSHIYGETCYQVSGELTCTEEERPAGHIHGDECYQTDTVLTCEQEELVLHTHEADCYDEAGTLTCELPEVAAHQHTTDCIIPAEGEPWEEQVLTCGMEEHIHSEECCDNSSGQESAEEEQMLICELEESENHTHSEECWSTDAAEEQKEDIKEELSQVEEVCALIEAIPTSGEIEEAIAAFEVAEDEDGLETYLEEVYRQINTAYQAYNVLTDTQKDRVANSDKLLELEWLWSASTWEVRANGVTVGDQSELSSAIEKGNSYILLGANIQVNNALAIPEGADITLDLNGYELTATGTAALFTVPPGTTLTVADSKQGNETVENSSGSLAGNGASLSGGTLTYYVTTTSVTDPDVGDTQEKLEKHTVSIAGAIVGGSQPVFQVAGGTLNVQSGVIYGGTGRAILQTEGTVNLSGGYLCGFTQSSSKTDNTSFGGAIKASGGTLNLNGTVLAGNKAHNGGAIYASGSVTITMTDGVISGNISTRTTSGWNDHSESGAYRCGGGGIYADGNAKITMSGGYITNNEAVHDGYFDGGGGLCLSGASKMVMSGGYITGNQAQGGGGMRTDFGKGTEFTMTGGFVSGNVSTRAEGGGIAIDRGGVGTVTGGYITNNKIPSTGHWGGGGLFCADGSTLNLKNTLITRNTAGGFGAGVAGCPTGNLYLYVTEGCAIFDNTDMADSNSPHFTSDGVKQIDKEICTEVFQANGHADYFCALNSTVTGTMLGNNAANWQGSADYQQVIADEEDVLTATKVMGLKANPTPEAKLAAEDAAKVYINGNYSYTHGGGIMCNGNLVIGVPVDVEVPARVELQATKGLVNGNGSPQSLEGNDFSFKATMTEPDGLVIANGTCDSNGVITFDHQLTFKMEGTFVYYVYEEADEADHSIVYDPTMYRLTISVTRDNGVDWYGETRKYTYSVNSIKVESSTDGEKWTPVSQSSVSASGVLSLPLTSDTTFVNRLIQPTKITVRKQWEGGSGVESVAVILKRDGAEYDRQTLSAGNRWTYSWNNLEPGHNYTVEEVPVDGYIASYEISIVADESGSTSLGQGRWWVPATEMTAGNQYMLVSPDGTKALHIASGSEGNGFDTADVRGVVQQQTAITINGQSYSNWYQAADIPARSIYNAENLTRSSGSGIVLKRSDNGEYPYLRLENNNNNSLKGASSTDYASFMVFDGTYLKGHNASKWTPDNLRTVIYDNGKFNSTTEKNPANGAKLYMLVSGEAFSGSVIESETIVITNTRDIEGGEYILPETGGVGTDAYTFGGLLLMLGAALLLYKDILRRKEDFLSTS